MIREKNNKTEYMLEYFIPRIEHFIHFKIMKYLDTSVRTWPKLTGDIITNVSKAERIFYRCLDITHQYFEHRSSILKRQMSWKLRRKARDILAQWIVFSFHLDICQQWPDIDHRYLLFSVLNLIFEPILSESSD